MRISSIHIREVLDSRAKKTLEIGVIDESRHETYTQIPTGESQGSREAVSFDSRKAHESVKRILPRLANREFRSVRDLDSFLIRFDGTPNKSVIGGNVSLGISIGFAKLFARHTKRAVWQTLQEEFFGSEKKKKVSYPKIFANVIEGGKHAANNLDFQEYLLIADTKQGVMRAAEIIWRVFSALQDQLRGTRRLRQVPIGDEDGISLDFKNNEAPIAFIEKIASKLKLAKSVSIGIDAAANSFYAGDAYRFEGKKRTKEQMLGYYLRLKQKHPLLRSIEDPFCETDFESFSEFHLALGERALVIGDDLTVTNPSLIAKARELDSISGVIIKPNQVGTLTETAKTIAIAKKSRIEVILSHRAREVEDATIISIARACNAYGVKIGVPQNERVVKYNELLRLYR